MTLGRTEIGMPFGLFDLLGHPFELSFAYGGQILAVRRRSRFLVEEYGQGIPLSHLLGHLFREGNGFVHRRVLDRDKRHHIYRSHAGMLAAMLVQVDQFHGYADRLDHGIP